MKFTSNVMKINNMPTERHLFFIYNSYFINLPPGGECGIFTQSKNNFDVLLSHIDWLREFVLNSQKKDPKARRQKTRNLLTMLLTIFVPDMRNMLEIFDRTPKIILKKFQCICFLIIICDGQSKLTIDDFRIVQH